MIKLSVAATLFGLVAITSQPAAAWQHYSSTCPIGSGLPCDRQQQYQQQRPPMRYQQFYGVPQQRFYGDQRPQQRRVCVFCEVLHIVGELIEHQ